MTAIASASEHDQIDDRRRPLLEAGVVALEWLAVSLGLRFGLYDALAAGPATAARVARRAQVHPRYAREWLEQQAVCRMVEVEDPTVHAEARVFRLPRASAVVLIDGEESEVVDALGLVAAGSAGTLPAIADAYRGGVGVAADAYGQEMRAGLAGLNRRAFVHDLARRWIPALPDGMHAFAASRPPRWPTSRGVACSSGTRPCPHASCYSSRALGSIQKNSQM